jgi:hypothetical protein
MPSSQRERIKPRSNSAMPPMIVIISLPMPAVVSHQVSPSDTKPKKRVARPLEDDERPGAYRENKAPGQRHPRGGWCGWPRGDYAIGMPKCFTVVRSGR